MSQQLLQDPSFEDHFDPALKGKLAYEVTPAGDVSPVQTMNIHPLEHWDFAYLKAPGVTAPEMRDAWKDVDPNRVRSGQKSLVCHVSDRYHAWWVQSVEVPGHGHVTFFAETRNRWRFRNSDTYIDDASLTLEDGQLTASAWMHAWSNHPNIPGFEHSGQPNCSVGVGCGPVAIAADQVDDWIEQNIPDAGQELKDAVPNFTMRVGIDPQGGINPLSDTVQWGPAYHIYNGYAHQLTCQLTLEESDEPEPPAPEPEPPVPPGDWPYPLIAVTGSNVGVHSIRANKVVGFAEQLVAAGASFPVVKAVDDMGWIGAVKAASPDTLTIGRFVWPGEGCQDVENWSPQQMQDHAEAAIQRITDRIQAQPSLATDVDYWEPYNEPDPNTVPGYAALAELQIVTMMVAEREGLKLALFSLNAGTPEWDEMVAMVDTGVFARARQGGHILALHEGTFVSHDPKQWWGDLIPGAPQVEGAGPLNFRYRYLYHLLQQRHEVVPLVVSEWYCGDEASATTQTIVEALKWYDEEASKDYWFWAAQPFTLGPIGGWVHTDYERFYEGGILDHIIDIKDRPNALPPEPDEPEPPYGYDRLVVVVDYGFIQDPDRRRAYYIEGADRGITVSPSWDDARRRPPGAETNTIEAPGIPLEHQDAHLAYVHKQDPDATVIFRDTPGDVEPPDEPDEPTPEPPPPPPPPKPLLIGLHDDAGGEWMRAQGMKGLCLAHWTFETHPSPRNFSHLANAGITVIARIGWGYADGSGTMPRPQYRDAWIDSAVQTIQNTPGVAYWHPWNEVNNASEWPGYGSVNLFPLTPQYVVEAYNQLWHRVHSFAKIGPPPLDPYFGPGSDNGAWWRYILANIDGADALYLHCKTQTNNPAEVWSYEKFSDWPLQWQYLHLRTAETYLDMVPQRFKNLPVYVGELNPQHLDHIGSNMGWKGDNTQWVHEACQYFRTQPVDGVVFYRFDDADPWGIRNAGALLGAIKAESER